jgi:FkbM family methyltransferase
MCTEPPETESYTVAETTAQFVVPDGPRVKERWHYDTEYDVLGDFIRTIDPDDVVFDIGAHIGTYTCFGARKATDGRMIAFEPHPTNIRRLKQNIAVNGGDTELVDKPLSATTTAVAFGSEDGITGGNGILPSETSESVRMQSVTGDQLVFREGFPDPDVVKIDVEGAEGLVIDGMKRALSEGCTTVYCELHPPADHRRSVREFGHSVEGIRSSLRTLGFDLEVINRRNRDIHLKAQK